MNTKPDEELLARWLEDELEGEQHEQVEAWVTERGDWVVKRAEIRRWKASLRELIPAAEDLPNGEFFNARIRRETRTGAAAVEPRRSRGRWGGGWFVPLAAAAGLVAGFVVGHGPGGGVGADTGLAPPAAELAPVLYTPESGVEAELVAARGATVIVLDGVESLPDSWDLPETAAVDRADEERARTVSNGGR